MAGGLNSVGDSISTTPTDVQPAGLTAPFSLNYNMGTPGTLDISMFGTTPIAGGGEVVQITFTSGQANPWELESISDLATLI